MSTASSATVADDAGFDPILMAVLANRFDAVVREMSNTLFRIGRSAILNTARDFSCSIVTADNRLLSAAEGLPVQVLGGGRQTECMREYHPDLAEGDAFLHNDPYLGNTHTADYTVLVPVFVGGTHLFTVCAKAHQADCGNSEPSTYMPFARDIYQEGGLVFPCVRIQRGHQDVEDIIRMCRCRIRPDGCRGRTRNSTPRDPCQTGCRHAARLSRLERHRNRCASNLAAQDTGVW